MLVLQKIRLGAVILPGPAVGSRMGRKPVLKGRTQGQPARVADDAGQMAYLLSYLNWAWRFFGEGTTGSEDCSAGAGIRPSESAGDLEVNLDKFLPRYEGGRATEAINQKTGSLRYVRLPCTIKRSSRQSTRY